MLATPMPLTAQQRKLLASWPAERRQLIADLLEARPCKCRQRVRLIPVGCASLPEAVRSLGPPCQHVLAAYHSVPLDTWIEFLEAVEVVDEEGPHDTYREPYTPWQKRTAIDQETRVQIMMDRHDHAEGLRHPADVHEKPRAAPLATLDGSGRVVCDTEAGRPRRREKAPDGHDPLCCPCWLCFCQQLLERRPA